MEKIRLYSFEDFKRIFARSGLKIIRTFGNYEGNKFNRNKSERLVILATEDLENTSINI
jgi:hypothetical protein